MKRLIPPYCLRNSQYDSFGCAAFAPKGSFVFSGKVVSMLSLVLFIACQGNTTQARQGATSQEVFDQLLTEAKNFAETADAIQSDLDVVREVLRNTPGDARQSAAYKTLQLSASDILRNWELIKYDLQKTEKFIREKSTQAGTESDVRKARVVLDGFARTMEEFGWRASELRVQAEALQNAQ